MACDELNFLGIGIETREECLDEITNNNARLNESAYKNTYDFYESMLEFSKSYFDINFRPQDIKLGNQKVSAKELSDLYNITYASKTPAVRVEWMIDFIMDKFNIETNVKDVSNRLKKII